MAGGDPGVWNPWSRIWRTFANQSSSPGNPWAGSLYCQCCELIDATKALQQGCLAGNPREPVASAAAEWAIVATRSLNAELWNPRSTR